MSKGITPLEAYKKISDYCEKWLTFDEELKIIETALKNYEELTSKPVILYGRTHGHTQALIDTICKNYKEVKITNLEDEKKLKAFEIIKEKEVNVQEFKNCLEECWDYEMCEKYCQDNDEWEENPPYSHSMKKEEFDLLREVLL